MTSRRPYLMMLAAALVLATSATSARAQYLNRGGYAPPSAGGSAQVGPAELEGVELTEKLGANLPLDLTFTDETGAPIELGSLFGDGLPVILTFNYSNCPMLCSVQLGGLVDALNQMKLEAGVQFRIITIGLDPKETHRRALDTKLSYLERYQRPRADEGWRFLTGKEKDIRALADSVGFGYRYLESKNEYLHPAALMVVSPQGMLSRYVYGVSFEPAELRAAIIAAGLEKITESSAKFLLSCFHYEAPQGFAGVATKIMRYGGLVFLVGLVAALIFAFRIRSTRALRAQRTGSTA